MSTLECEQTKIIFLLQLENLTILNEMTIVGDETLESNASNFNPFIQHPFQEFVTVTFLI